MLSYCLKWRKKTESKKPRVAKKNDENQCFYQNLQCVIVKKRDLTKNKKLVDY